MPNWHAITLTSKGGLLRSLTSDCQVAEGHDPSAASSPPWHPFGALWDTGATNSAITQAVVDLCGLKPVGMVNVSGVHGTRPAEQYLINVLLPNGVGFPNILVTKGDIAGTDILIGMDIISTGDFSVTNTGGLTIFSFRVPSQQHVDFVKEHAALKLRESQKHGGSKANRVKKPKIFGKKKR